MTLAHRLMLCIVIVWSPLALFATDVWKIDKASNCRFEIPSTWDAYSVQWIGNCGDGKAQGFGILKAYRNRKLSEQYYGRFDHGTLAIGVIETDGGYIAGRFADGRRLESEDRNTVIAAFREASAAANWASNFYRDKGNIVSARYYGDRAKRLANQID